MTKFTMDMEVVIARHFYLSSHHNNDRKVCERSFIYICIKKMRFSDDVTS